MHFLSLSVISVLTMNLKSKHNDYAPTATTLKILNILKNGFIVCNVTISKPLLFENSIYRPSLSFKTCFEKQGYGIKSLKNASIVG